MQSSRSTSDRKREHGSFIIAHNKKDLSSCSPDKLSQNDPHADAPDPQKFTLEADEEVAIAGDAYGIGDIFGEDGMGEVDLVDDGFFE